MSNEKPGDGGGGPGLLVTNEKPGDGGGGVTEDDHTKEEGENWGGMSNEKPGDGSGGVAEDEGEHAAGAGGLAWKADSRSCTLGCGKAGKLNS